MKFSLAGFVWAALVATVLATAALAPAASAGTYDLVIDDAMMNVTGRARPAMAINGQIPGPTLRLREGEDVVINVTNKLDETASIHWHGILLPFTMDGVPQISFDGIQPGETFTYRFKVEQAGTYWYHSHSGLQEQSGVYGPLVIEPADKEPHAYDRDYVVLLSDWTDEDPHAVMAKLKTRSGYYNFNKRTVGDFFRDIKNEGLGATIENRLMWGRMRMDPTDISDVTGYTYTYLVNGENPRENWTALMEPGERVRLRFINGSAMTIFDVKIPGLKMTVIEADGQDVDPVTVDEFRISVAETYDVIVEPEDREAYTIFAAALDRSGYARGTLAQRQGLTAAVPALGEPPILTMADMGDMGDMSGMDHGSGAGSEVSGGSGMGGMDHAPSPAQNEGAGAGMNPGMNHGDMPDTMPGMQHDTGQDADEMAYTKETPAAVRSMDHGASLPMVHAAEMTGQALGPKALTYDDLRAAKPFYDIRAPGREILVRLTGNMERFIWSINGKKYSDAEPIRLTYGERVRIKFVNETMMNHPMHLHGMWQVLENGNGVNNPLKHTVNVGPGETVFVDVSADAPGDWAFHCHLLYHMDTGMFRKVIVEGGDELARR